MLSVPYARCAWQLYVSVSPSPARNRLTRAPLRFRLDPDFLSTPLPLQTTPSSDLRPPCLGRSHEGRGRHRQDTPSAPSGRWRVEVGSCRVAGGDGTLATVDVGAPRRRRPRAAAPPKPPKWCSYQCPGPGPSPPLARRAGRGGGGNPRAAGPRTGAAAGTLRRGRRALRS